MWSKLGRNSCMHAVPLGESSTVPLHPGYVPSVFSFKKSTEKKASSRYVRARDCSKLRSVQSASAFVV